MLLTAIILCAVSFLLLRYAKRLSNSRRKRKKVWVVPLNIAAFILAIVGVYYLYIFFDSIDTFEY